MTNTMRLNNLKTIAYLMLVYFVTSCESKTSISTTSIIPTPTNIEQKEGRFILTEDCKIFTDNFERIEYALDFFDVQINNSIGFKPTRTGSESVAQIIIRKIADEALGNEGYYLNISKDGIEIQSNGANGVYYAFQSIFKLFPEGFKKENTTVKAELPALSISDIPEFAYRGMMLDVGRHIFPMEFIKEFIDNMARYKMNVFHWHLTEDQGWRLAIDKYPELTEIGAWRDSTITSAKNEPEVYNNERYGGFYTKEQIQEIIEYAAKNFVEVIPEIEMPGHSQAALTAYPELGCTGGPYKVKTEWGVSEDVYCAGNELTFEFLENVLDEVIDLFPSKYIHIGGDECRKTSWEVCPKCQARIAANNLKDEKELQSYFIKRMEKYLNSKGKQIIGWDEILEGGIAENATVMVWRDVEEGIAAIQQNHDVILTPKQFFYLDKPQGPASGDTLIPKEYITVERIYNFNPKLDELTSDEQKHILGVQGCLWTEYIPTIEKAQFMMMPRMAAIAETAWRGSKKNDFNKFKAALEAELKRLNNLGINHASITTDEDYGKMLKQHQEIYEQKYKSRGLSKVPGKYLETFDGTQGLNASFYNDRNLRNLIGTRIDTKIDIYTDNPPDSLLVLGDKSVRWEGNLVSPQTGELTLGVISDDGVRIWLDEELIIDAWQTQGSAVFEKIFNTNKGNKHKLKVEWFDGGGDFVCQLLWKTE